jgi:hypothetical protein
VSIIHLDGRFFRQFPGCTIRFDMPLLHIKVSAKSTLTMSRPRVADSQDSRIVGLSSFHQKIAIEMVSPLGY